MDSNTLQTIKDTFQKYMEGLSGIFTKDKDTAQGNDLKKEEPLTISQTESDGRDFANQVFQANSNSGLEHIVLADAYDQTQALTRLSKIYSKTRKDYYDEAIAYNKTQQQRVEHKKKYVLNALDSVQKLYSGGK